MRCSGQKRSFISGPTNTEAIYNLGEDRNHENFLDLIKLLACYDRELACHLDKITRRAVDLKAKKESSSTTTDAANKKCVRGNRITFLSKTTL